MEPWSREPVGTLRGARDRERAAARQPARRPARPAALGLPPAGLRRRARPPLPLDLPDPGDDRPARHVAEPHGLPPERPELVDRLFAEEGCPPALVVFVDCWTSYGGSQFIDSPGTGRYHEYLCEEVVPFVDARYRTLAEAAHRGIDRQVERRLRRDGRRRCCGPISSAGSPPIPATRCSSSATCPSSAQAVRALRDDYDGSYERFWEDFRSRPAFTKQSDYSLVNRYAMAACYSANEDGSIDLPFDPATGMLRDDVWQRWLAWDPVRMVRRHADALRSLRAIYIDAGTRDEWFLDLGAEAFRRELEAVGDHRRLLRAVRRGARRDRVPLPARDPLPRRAAAVARLGSSFGRRRFCGRRTSRSCTPARRAR